MPAITIEKKLGRLMGGQEWRGVAICTVVIRAGLTGKVILSKEGNTEHGDAREKSR